MVSVATGGGNMDFSITLYNGFNIGLERKVNSPTWLQLPDGFDIFFFSGIQINLGFVRISLGRFKDADEFAEELGDP